MGLIVDIFRSSRNGVIDGCPLNKFNHVSTLCLVNVRGPSEPDANAPAALLIKGNLPGMVKIVPAGLGHDGYVQSDSQVMFGGAYAATSDSRFSDAVENIIGSRFYGAVPIHDRVE